MADDDLPPEGEDGGDTVVLENQEEEQQQEAEPVTIDGLASKMGWTPKEQWRGDPEKWRDASDFLVSTVDVNRGLVSKLDNVERTLANVARTSAQLTDQAVAKERERLMQARAEAFDTGDREAFDNAEKQLNTLQSQPVQQMAPEAEQFAQRNSSWFQKDPEATAWTINRATELARQGLGPKRQVEIVEREARQMFPDLFPEQKSRGAPLNKPGARGASATQKGFSALPADAQKAALDYEKAGRCTKEEYAKIYFEEEA